MSINVSSVQYLDISPKNNIALRLTIMSFLQFFVWGAWLITIGVYWFQFEKWPGDKFGEVFSTLGIASLIMPPLVGIIADKWLNAEKLYGILHFGYAAMLFCLPFVKDPDTFFWVMLIAMSFYMPTISLSNSIAYYILKNNNYDVVLVHPSQFTQTPFILRFLSLRKFYYCQEPLRKFSCCLFFATFRESSYRC